MEVSRMISTKYKWSYLHCYRYGRKAVLFALYHVYLDIQGSLSQFYKLVAFSKMSSYTHQTTLQCVKHSRKQQTNTYQISMKKTPIFINTVSCNIFVIMCPLNIQTVQLHGTYFSRITRTIFFKTQNRFILFIFTFINITGFPFR